MCDGVGDLESMVGVYRHDVHKALGRSHGSARESFAGVSVNDAVPLGADRDAALLSRPSGDPAQTLEAHASPYRVSLLTGQAQAPVGDETGAWRDLVRIEDPEEMHRAWLDAAVPARYHESIYYPYTSLKYHVLLTAALVDNYRAGAGFADVSLVVDAPERDGIVPHRTVLVTDAFALRVTSAAGGRASASLGGGPARSFADTWGRLSGQPVAGTGDRRWMVLDAQLRRIRAWSTALQYIEEYVAAFGVGGGDSG